MASITELRVGLASKTVGELAGSNRARGSTVCKGEQGRAAKAGAARRGRAVEAVGDVAGIGHTQLTVKVGRKADPTGKTS